MKKLVLILLAICFAFHTNANSAKPDTVKVIILALNDQHAKVDNYDKLKSMVDEMRSTNPNVLLFSSGDNFTGNPIVDMYHDKGFPIIDLMNIVGFNASAIGNHEFDYGQQVLLKRMEQANFPFLSSNIIDQTGRLPIKPYKIITLESGIKISIISAIQLGNNNLPDSHPNNLNGLSFNDGISSIEQYKSLRDSSNIFIALTHLGFEKDIELAEKMPQLDLILGGHTHTLTNPAHTVKNVTIMQSGSNVRNLSKATIYLVNGKVIKVVPEMLSITDYKKTDEFVSKKLIQFNDNKELNRAIGNNLTDLTTPDELGSLMTDAITSINNIDIAFQNNGGIRIDYLKAGPITVKDIYKLDPFGNEIILIKMKPYEIKSLILNSYTASENSLDLQVSGMTYKVITDHKGNAFNVEMKDLKNKSLRRNKTYTVGLNSYIASSYHFDHKDPGKSLFKTTAQTLIEYLSIKKQVDYKGQKRIYKAMTTTSLRVEPRRASSPSSN